MFSFLLHELLTSMSKQRERLSVRPARNTAFERSHYPRTLLRRCHARPRRCRSQHHVNDAASVRIWRELAGEKSFPDESSLGIRPVEIDRRIREVVTGKRSIAVLRFRALVEQVEIDLPRLDGNTEKEFALPNQSPPRSTLAATSRRRARTFPKKALRFRRPLCS